MGRTVAAELVDHIVPHRGDMELFWDEDNWQSSCNWHHNAVKRPLEDLFDKGALVASDLKLDGSKAIEMTQRLDP